jgi:Type II secretory pathway, pullulanase PulA and related glycosidases
LAVKIEIVPARALHIRTIAKRMRQADRDEVLASSGKTPLEALRYSMRKSAFSWAVLVNGRPEVMFGVCNMSVLTDTGIPWLLGTDAIDRHYVAFLRQSAGCLAQLSARYPILRNFVDDRNVVSIRWLRWLGFTISEPVHLNGHDFRMFELRSG